MKWLVLGVATGLFLFGAAVLGFSADFDGDGKDDIAVQNSSTGKWIVRGVTKIFFGQSGDIAAAGDYDGDGIGEFAFYRPSSGLWKIKDSSRVYLGGSGYSPVLGGGAKYSSDYIQVDEASSRLSLLPEVTIGTLTVGPDFTGHGTDGPDVQFVSPIQLSEPWYARLLWKSSRSALYVGYPDSSDFTGNDLGMCSLSVGDRAEANGYCSLAVGSRLSCLGSHSIALGEDVFAMGSHSLATGHWARAANDYSLAMGQWVWSDANNAFVLGKGEMSGGELYNNYPDSLMIGFNTRTAPAFFVDQTGVGCGMIPPVRSLHVGDVMRLEPQDSSPTDPDEGDIYFDNITKKLRCYDGTTWQDCF